jgi:hypothetical protein
LARNTAQKAPSPGAVSSTDSDSGSGSTASEDSDSEPLLWRLRGRAAPPPWPPFALRMPGAGSLHILPGFPVLVLLVAEGLGASCAVFLAKCALNL